MVQMMDEMVHAGYLNRSCCVFGVCGVAVPVQ